MKPELPPPDPHERPYHEAAGELSIAAPMAVFASGCTSVDQRISDALLELRPGLLIVCGRA